MRQMGVLVMRKKLLSKAVSLILQLSFVVSIFMVPLEPLFAAQVSIDTAVSTAQLEHVALGSTVVFTTDQVGYKFYTDGGGNCAYSKTTNGGTSWGVAVSIDAQTDCYAVVVWYDKWTPGDSGNNIHIVTADPGNDDVWYNALDTTTDTRLLTATPVSVVTNSGQGGTFAAGSSTPSIAKATNGTLYVAMNNYTDSYVVECSTTCQTNTNWTETGTNPMDVTNDFSLLMPLADGDMLLINRDLSADDLRSKVWDDGAGSWSGTWTAIETNALENATYDPAFSAAVNIRTGDVYLALVDNATTGTVGGNNDDIRTYSYSGGTWTAKGDVLTNSTLGVTDVTIGLDAYDGDVYVGYVARTTPGTAGTARAYWKSSTNGMTSWGGQTGPIDTVGAEEKYGISLNMTGEERMYLTWYGITSDDAMGDTIANLIPATALLTQGTQATQLRASTTNQYLGAAFVASSTGTAKNVTSFEITETGSVDAAVDLDNIKLFYEFDTSAPYNCASEAYGSGGAETQYGSTDTDGFSAANGVSTFTGSVAASTTQSVCFYVVADIKQSANTKNIEIEVPAPTADVLVSGNVTMTPLSAVALAGTTNVVDSNLTQTNYHWRYDNGNETAATSRTAGAENTSSNIQQETPVRLRIGVSNSTGATTTTETKFRLEYAPNPSVCSAATGWIDVNAATDDWNMYDSAFVTNAADTTDISVASGGVTNVGTTFLTPNGGQLDTTSQTGSTTLGITNHTELEYTIVPATTIPENTQYCFRVTDAGEALPVYTNYAQATVRLSNDFRIQRGNSIILAGQSTVTITAGSNYDFPNSTTTAFIRITNSGLTGAGPSVGAGNSNASNVMAYVSNPENLLTSITFTRAGTTNDTRISWEIIEYQGVAGGENEMKVRKAEVLTYTNGVATDNGTTASGVVDDTDVAVFITGQGNPNANRTAYVSGLSTAAWDSTNDRAVLTRAATTGAVPASVAVVEFTGTNWKIQRSEHTYTAAGSTETNSITAVNSLSRTFLHVQKRASVNTHANFSHEVWLSGIGQISFLLDAAATTPGGQTTVAWVIENTQTTGGTPMDVTRSSSLLDNVGTSPETNNIAIGKTLTDLSIASIFVNNRSDTALATWPEPIMGARIISTTQYELWRSDITANLNYRTEIVEWPTAVRKLEQEAYQLFEDNDALLPTTSWAGLGENAEMTANDTPTTIGDKIRIRMSLKVTGAAMAAGADAFKLQFGRRTTASCAGVTTWLPVGEIGSTTAAWRGVNNTPADAALLSLTDPPTGGDLLLSASTVAGTYEEENNSATNPFAGFPNDQVEYDWVVQHNSTAAEKSSYCFRMVEDDNTPMTAYNNYPVIRTVGYEPLITDWRWYDDESSLTPSTALSGAGENVAPSNVANQNVIKLRLVLRESSGANGNNVKFALQYSEYADFSQSVHTLTSTSTCAANSLWCFADGAGIDNAVISTKVITSADTCSGGVGNGCGTHNEGTSTVGATADQLAYADTEYEFTVRHAGARTNAVYYFRVYNLTYDEVVTTAPTYSYPSLVTEGAAMLSSVTGVGSGTSIAGITTDIATSPTAIGFGSLNFNTDYEAAQQIAIDTNATEGYQLLAYGQNMLNSYGDPIPPVTGTNATPGGWGSVCNIVSQTGCFGYHTTDATLDGGSNRFSPTDSYAALDTTPREVMYSSIPTSDTENMIYRIKISALQAAGSYTSDIVYIAVPVH